MLDSAPMLITGLHVYALVPDWEWMPLGTVEAARINYEVQYRTKFAFDTLAENIEAWLTGAAEAEERAEQAAIIAVLIDEETDTRQRRERKRYMKNRRSKHKLPFSDRGTNMYDGKILDVCEYMERGFAVLADDN